MLLIVLSLTVACSDEDGAPSPMPAAALSPTVQPTPTLRPSRTSTPQPTPTATTYEATAEAIRRNVTGAQPLLLPTAIPDGWTVEAVTRKDSFAVIFTLSSEGKRVLFGLDAANAPLAQAETTQAFPKFRGDPRAFYQVMNRYDVGSPRQLMWVEPGTWAETLHLGGPIYFLTSIGLTDEEFWRIANSLEPIQPAGGVAISARFLRLFSRGAILPARPQRVSLMPAPRGRKGRRDDLR